MENLVTMHWTHCQKETGHHQEKNKNNKFDQAGHAAPFPWKMK